MSAIKVIFLCFLIHHTYSIPTAKTETPPVESRGCMVMENIFIKAGETAQLPDCVQLQCLDKGDHILAITSMCPSAQEPPPGCHLLPKPVGPFPECCAVTFVCEKVVEKLVPVVYDRNNITDIDEEGRKQLLELAGIPQNNADQPEKTNKLDEIKSLGFDPKDFGDDQEGQDLKKFIIENLHKKEKKQ